MSSHKKYKQQTNNHHKVIVAVVKVIRIMTNGFQSCPKYRKSSMMARKCVRKLRVIKKL